MSLLVERIVEISNAHPEMVSREIGNLVGCSEYYVRTVWQRYEIARNPGNRGADPLTVIPRRVKLHKQTYETFFRESERRNVSVEALLDSVLEAVAQDNLFRAVLDD